MCDKKEHTEHYSKHCQNEFETSYSPDRPEVVYCESCYNRKYINLFLKVSNKTFLVSSSMN